MTINCSEFLKMCTIEYNWRLNSIFSQKDCSQNKFTILTTRGNSVPLFSNPPLSRLVTTSGLFYPHSIHFVPQLTLP